ncbi:HD domain-containing protein [Viscerimonas tarda]
MNLQQGTLQDWFYNQEQYLNLFPDKKNYVSYYKSFKDFLDREIHPHIGTVMSRENPVIFLNDHSAKHVDMVIEKASYLLLGLEESIAISPYETFMLLTAIQIHDAGHIVNANRDTHAEDSKKLVQELDNKNITTWEKKIILDIAKAHSGKDDLIGKQKLSDGNGVDKIRYRLLSAILRMADELADGRARAANYLLSEGRIPPSSEIYHAFSSCLEKFNVSAESHEITMIFSLNKEQSIKLYKKSKSETELEELFLINEIYKRTLKTFNECLYYNRFVPENMRISSVSVEINLLEAESIESFFEPIKYRIEERGYPILSSNDIFEICKESLVNSAGENIDGQYIANQINNQLLCKKK